MNSELEQLFSLHPRPMTREPAYLLLNRSDPGNAERMRIFNRGLEKVRSQFAHELENGLLKAIDH
jgi:hypothetical protein